MKLPITQSFPASCHFFSRR